MWFIFPTGFIFPTNFPQCPYHFEQKKKNRGEGREAEQAKRRDKIQSLES